MEILLLKDINKILINYALMKAVFQGINSLLWIWECQIKMVLMLQKKSYRFRKSLMMKIKGNVKKKLINFLKVKNVKLWLLQLLKTKALYKNASK